MSVTREEAAHILEYSRIVSENFTQEAVTATYVMALSALRGPTRKQVEKMRGEWIADGEKVPVDENGCPRDWAKCSVCGEYLTASEEYDCTGHFCPNCGAPMTDKAVDMVMERVEALYEEKSASEWNMRFLDGTQKRNGPKARLTF